MTVPALAAYRFLCICLLGCALGLFYGSLRPLRLRHPGIADTLFLLAAAWVWLYLSFGICRGDLRIGSTAGLMGGAVFWEWSAGRCLRPVFSKIWGGFDRILTLLRLPAKKILKFAKKILASAKKWVTIKCNNIRSCCLRPGGASHEREDQARAKGKGDHEAQS